ncbi:hypothetical protein B7P43_G05967, partial [Cryptotermes secundus]
VSWIRRRDAHILTVDRYTFIADERFQSFLVEATDTWTLQIKYVQARDAGKYECQVSTEPKLSHVITLNVVVYTKRCCLLFFSLPLSFPTSFRFLNTYFHSGIVREPRGLCIGRSLGVFRNNYSLPEDGVWTHYIFVRHVVYLLMLAIVLLFAVPKIEIMGESDLYVKTGSTVNLKCVITQSLEEPAYIFWYHDNERVLNYDSSSRDIRMERVGPDTTVGTLIIYNGRREDSGNYTCSPSNLDSASVLLHVLNGKTFPPHASVISVGQKKAYEVERMPYVSDQRKIVS